MHKLYNLHKGNEVSISQSEGFIGQKYEEGVELPADWVFALNNAEAIVQIVLRE